MQKVWISAILLIFLSFDIVSAFISSSSSILFPKHNYNRRVGVLPAASTNNDSSSGDGTDKKTFITFDVDGTLLTGSGQAADTSAHARAFSHAVQEVLVAKGSDTTIPPVADVLPSHKFHGSTDGLILLRLAYATLGIKPNDILEKNQLNKMMNVMYNYINKLSDNEISNGLSVLPGVLETLDQLKQDNNVICGLVTGNVEGIARRKMNAMGIYQTNSLHPPSKTQLDASIDRFKDSQHLAFIGGFGSDYCSYNIKDDTRNYLDRGQQFQNCY